MESFKQAEDLGFKKGSKMFIMLCVHYWIREGETRSKTAVFEQFRFL
jgi:hypothetical protein